MTSNFPPRSVIVVDILGTVPRAQSKQIARERSAIEVTKFLTNAIFGKPESDSSELWW
jgi:hypothetical protein